MESNLKEVRKVNDNQMDLLREIISEQLSDYLAEKLANDLTASIMEGINDNLPLFEDMGREG